MKYHEVPHGPLLRCDNVHLSVVLLTCHLYTEERRSKLRPGKELSRRLQGGLLASVVGVNDVRNMPAEVLQHHFENTGCVWFLWGRA